MSWLKPTQKSNFHVSVPTCLWNEIISELVTFNVAREYVYVVSLCGGGLWDVCVWCGGYDIYDSLCAPLPHGAKVLIRQQRCAINGKRQCDGLSRSPSSHYMINPHIYSPSVATKWCSIDDTPPPPILLDFVDVE